MAVLDRAAERAYWQAVLAEARAMRQDPTYAPARVPRDLTGVPPVPIEGRLDFNLAVAVLIEALAATLGTPTGLSPLEQPPGRPTLDHVRRYRAGRVHLPPDVDEYSRTLANRYLARQADRADRGGLTAEPDRGTVGNHEQTRATHASR